MKCVGVGRLNSIESSNNWPLDMISLLAMSVSVSGMLITLLVVASASSLTDLCGSDSAGSRFYRFHNNSDSTVKFYH